MQMLDLKFRYIFIWLISVLFLLDIINPYMWSNTEMFVMLSFREYIKTVEFWYRAIMVFFIIYINYKVQKNFYKLIFVSFIMAIFIKNLILVVNIGFEWQTLLIFMLKSSIEFIVILYFLTKREMG